VDFGCGRNDFIGALRRLNIDGLGIDFAFPEADVPRPMHKTGLLDGVADVVTSFDALEHLLPEDVDAVLAEMRRVARPGGHFIFSICTRPSRVTVGGEGLHPTVQPLGWWLERIGRFGTVTAAKGEGRYIVGRIAAKEGCGCA
jgi:SAM-dependent methyltransferase